MLALVVCATFAQNPLVIVQLRYPVNRVTITAASGSFAYYALPRDAPPELQRAYKVLEFAERQAILTEALQMLKIEYVQNERRLEAVRTNAIVTAYLGGGPGYNCGGFFYSMPVEPPESLLKQHLAGGIARDATAERALLAIDRLAEAQFQLHRTWVGLAFPDLKAPGGAPRPLPVPPPAAVGKTAAPPVRPQPQSPAHFVSPGVPPAPPGRP